MTTIIECRPTAAAAPTPDIKAVKTKQQAAWSSGDYAIIGITLQIVGERLAEAMDLRARRTLGRCPEITPSCSVAASSTEVVCFASPMPMLTVTFCSRGTSMRLS